MAVQSSSGLGVALQANLLQGLFRNNLSAYRQATNALNNPRIFSGRILSQAFLNSRLSNLKNIAELDQAQKSKADIGVTALQGVADDLDQLSSLAAAAVNETDPTQLALLQSQAQAVLNTISSTLNTAKKNDNGLVTPVFITSAGPARGIDITGVDQDLTSSGYSFTLSLTSVGSRTKLADVIDTSGGTAGQMDNAVSFLISGPKGSAQIDLIVGDTVGTIVNKINAQSDATGTFANISGTSNDRVDIISSTVGANTISITELTSDPGSEINTAPTTTAGTALTGTLTVNGYSTTVSSTDGRNIIVDHAGGSGVINLLDSDTLTTNFSGAAVTGDFLGGGAGTTTFTVKNGGRAILGEDGVLIGRLGISAFEYSSIAREKGGLGSIDLSTNAAGAIAILAQAQHDIGNGIATASFIADSMLGQRITDNSEMIGTLNSSLTDLKSMYEALDAYDRLVAEARQQSALSVLSQLSLLFPVTSVGLL
jgi:hypothetical protein